ncbi:hypothetical protein JCM6882_006933 [Rhodosporidiobolus microsporus]
MTNTPAARLPSVGTVFPSLASFKLTSFETAVSASYNLLVWRSPSKTRSRSELRCDGLGNRETYRRRHQKCSCFVAVKLSGGQCKVVEVCDQHSCGYDPSSSGAAGSRWEMERKLASLKEDLVGSDDESESASSASTEDDDGAPSSKADKQEPTTTKFGRSSLAVDRDTTTSNTVLLRSRPDHPDDGRAAYDTLQAGEKTQYPSKFVLKKEIAVLVASGPLSLPPPSTLFSTAAPLMTHLYAYAQQQNFPISREITVRRIRFLCQNRKNGVRCRWEKVALQDEEGRWRLSPSMATSEHDYGCDGSVDSATTASNAIPPPAVVPDAPPSSKVFRPLPPPKRPRLDSAASPSPSHSHKPVKAQIAAPPRADTALSPTLSRGISTVQDLAQLLKVEKGILFATLDMIKEGGAGASEVELLENALDGLRIAFETEE